MPQDHDEALILIRKVAFRLARADLGVSVLEWEAMPLSELFKWHNDAVMLSEQEEQERQQNGK